MKKLLFTLVAGVSAATLFADDAAKVAPDSRRNAFMRVMGGFIDDTRNLKGRVAIVNAQKSADEAWLRSAAATFAHDVKIKVEVVPGTFDFKKPELKGEATVFVVDDPALPMSLNAPESRWSVVNVAPLKTDKLPFYKSRVERSIVRAIVPLLCGSDSQFPLCLMGAVHKPEDLDRFVNARLPVDVIQRFKQNFDALGLGAWERTTYRTAVAQGWAPAPTNDIQKAIWDKVHELPSNPIKIKYDPKRDK